MTNEEKKAIDKLKNGKKYTLVEIIRVFKKEGIENFRITRKEYLETILNLLEKKDKEYAELLIKVNAQNLNNSIEQRKESNEQLEALHEGWKIELEKKDNRIKELEADNYECNNRIREYIEDWELKTKMIELMAEHLTAPIHSKKNVIEYFENLAKESGEIDEDNRIIE